MPGWALTLRAEGKARSGFLCSQPRPGVLSRFHITLGASPSGDADGTVPPCRVGDPGA
jgi:hypothetical protein